MPRTRKEKGHFGGGYRALRSRVLLEEAICYLCGEGVDKTLPWRHPGAPQLHLIIPITRGGSWRDRSNAKLTHRLCNVRQSNRLDGEVAHVEPGDRWVIADEP